MVMKRYPNGAAGEYFFMKRAPGPRPAWIRTCSIQHSTGMIEFPIIQDLACLLWIVNLGCPLSERTKTPAARGITS
jgi:bifunctional non-homologous end joining protein LigD